MSSGAFPRAQKLSLSVPQFSLGFLWLLAIVATITIAAEADTRSPPLAWTKFGQIRGKWSRSARNIPVANFLGIPYADPPMGPMRFRNPRPWNHTWLELRDGTRDAPECLQLGKHDKVIGSEDCLYLNVFVPLIPGDLHHERLPVIVFLHGGSFSTGKGSSRLYAADYLMDQEIILVTLNYRLNIFGFLSTESKASPGNYGLKDIVTALQWVQDNIASFNGDANSVTLFGHSSGAMAAHILALTNKTEGLFHRYIIQSGSAFSTCAVHQPKMMRFLSFALMKKLGCTADTFDENSDSAVGAERKSEVEVIGNTLHHHVQMSDPQDNGEHFHIDEYDSFNDAQEEELIECMRNVGAREMLHPLADARLWMDQPQCFIGPTVEKDVEGAILTEYPIVSIAQSTFRDIPFIMGVVKDEGLLKTIDILTNPILQNEFIDHYGRLLPFLCEWHEVMVQDGEILDAITDFYFSGNVSGNLIPNITKVVSDTMTMWPSFSALNLQSLQMNSTVYFYLFSYEGTFSNTFKTGSTLHYGVSHGDDLNYIFPYLNYIYKDLQLHNTGNDWTMINIMTEMWGNFARRGVPEARLIPSWPNYKTKHEFLKFGDGVFPDVSTETEFFPARIEFWQKMSANMTVTPMNLGELMKAQEKNENNGNEAVGNNLSLLCIVFLAVLSVS